MKESSVDVDGGSVDSHPVDDPRALVRGPLPLQDLAPHARIVVVSNRLPFTLPASGQGEEWPRAVGGLVSGVEAFLAARAAAVPGADHVWIGWPGVDRPAAERERIRAEAMSRHRAHPVFLRAAEAEAFYAGFANRALWPLFHYFPSYVSIDDRDWAVYETVNRRYRDAVLEVLRPGDVVWVHDYHLMLLPALLREKAPDLPISFFLHVPFPAYEVFRVLPDAWARALLEGILGADVVGVHTYDYARHVLRSAQRLLGIDHRQGDVTVGGRVVRVEAFPIGIDFARYAGAAADPAVAVERDLLRTSLGDRRAILSVDRLDYTKGIRNRLLAFEAFLERHPEWHQRVSLVAVSVPSRTGIESYRRMRRDIEETVGRVNGRFGSVGWTPILYQFRALEFPALAALYGHCDVALVTPLRDGMNLVAKEYVAARTDEAGVLVLSDTAGAARELGEALLVNPYHVDGVADAIHAALEMPLEERKRRNAALRARISRYDVVRWGSEQLALLGTMREVTRRFGARLLPTEAREAEARRWLASGRRLLLLDYDGTLVPFADDPAAVHPDPDLLALLRRLGEDPCNRVVLVSGRDARTLDSWFGGLPLALVAEHGARTRDDRGEWATPAVRSPSWKERIVPVMEVFADRLPGSIVEQKEYCVAWHYRAADDELGPARARELVEALQDVRTSAGVHVIRGNKVVEARPLGFTKGTAAADWVARVRPDYVLAVGDDETDEDMFAALPEDAFSIRVGLGESRARYNLDGPQAVRRLLGDLAASSSVPGHPPAGRG